MGAAGHAAKVGYREAAGWNTAFQQANQIVPFISEGLTAEYDQLRSQALIGEAASHEFFNGHQKVAGNLDWELDYDNLGLLKYAFGAESAGVFSLANDLSAGFHLEIDKITKRYRFGTCYFNSLTISGEAGSTDPIKCSGNVVSRNVTRSDTAFPSLTDSPNRAYWPHTDYLYLGDQANALTSDDEIAIKSWELSLENNLQVDAIDTSDPDYVLSPLRNGFRKVTLKFSLARVNTDTASLLPGWKDEATRLQGILRLANGSDSILIYLPETKIAEGGDWNVGGPGVIEGEVTLEAFVNRNNTPMSTVSDQVEIHVA